MEFDSVTFSCRGLIGEMEGDAAPPPQKKRRHNGEFGEEERRRLDNFVSEEWEVAVKPTRKPSVKCVVPHRIQHINFVKRLLMFIPLAVWNVLVLAVNQQLSELQPEGGYVFYHSNNMLNFLFLIYRYNYKYKRTTVHELLGFYGVWMDIESTYGNSTQDLCDHINAIWKAGFPKIHGFGMDCIQALIAALQPS